MKKITKPARPRKSRDRMLLEALLNGSIIENVLGETRLAIKIEPKLKQREYKWLVAIKEAMERKGGGK